MVGRPSVISENQIAELINILKRRIDDFYLADAKKIVGPSNQCWTEITKELSFMISTKYVYVFVQQNRHNVHVSLGIEVRQAVDAPPSVMRLCADDSETENSDSDDNSMTLKMSLTADEWNSLLGRSNTG